MISRTRFVDFGAYVDHRTTSRITQLQSGDSIHARDGDLIRAIGPGASKSLLADDEVCLIYPSRYQDLTWLDASQICETRKGAKEME